MVFKEKKKRSVVVSRISITILALFAFSVSAARAGDLRGAEMYYELGGGQPWSRPSSPVDPIGGSIGVRWNVSSGCDGFDFNISLESQFNGLTGQLQQTMGNIFNSVRGAIAQLPGAILQRANPALYDMITNGVLQASKEFNLAQLDCERVSEKLNDIVLSDKWSQVATGQYWEFNKKNSSSQDILSIKKDAKKKGGNEGVTWVGGQKKGGATGTPIRLVKDTSMAGYNLLQKRSPANTTAPPPSQCKQSSLCEYWDTPDKFAEWMIEVLGEKNIRTCENCNRIDAKPGTGLAPVVEEEMTTIRTTIANMVDNPAQVTPQNIRAASGGPQMRMTRAVIAAIRGEDPSEQDQVISKIASEMALIRTVEKAMIARRTLLAGKSESNIATLDIAQDDIALYIDELEREIDNLLYEIEVRKKVAGNTAAFLLRRARSRQAEKTRREDPADYGTHP